MINENILNLIDEVQFINEEFNEDSLEQLRQGSLDMIKKATGTAAHIGISSAISGSAAMAAYPVLGPIVGAIAGGFISPIIVGLVAALLNYKKVIEFYKKQYSKITDPDKKAELQTKINNLNQKITEKRTKLNKARNDLNKRTNEMRVRINEMERNKKSLSPAELGTLEKYKKIVANRMKVMPKLNG